MELDRHCGTRPMTFKVRGATISISRRTREHTYAVLINGCKTYYPNFNFSLRIQSFPHFFSTMYFTSAGETVHIS